MTSKVGSGRGLLAGLVGFEVLLYAAVGLLLVTAQFERRPAGGRALTNLLLELGLLGFLALALSLAVFLVRRGRSASAVGG